MADIFNPFENDEVVGVVSPDRAAATVSAAEAAGFTAELVTDASAIDVDGDAADEGLFASVLRFFQEGEEKDTLRRFERRLRQGDNIIRLLDVGERADEAGRLLAEHHAEVVWHFGSWTYRPLHDA